MDCTGFQLDPRKLAVVKKFPTPKCHSIYGYYRRFIVGYAKIIEPLFTLTKKECKFFWTTICQVVFVALKRRLVETPILVRHDFNKPFILHHVGSECGGQSTDSFSEEELRLMNHMEYKRMVVEVQTMVDEAINR